MSNHLKVPRCQKYSPRMSQEELKAHTTEAMRDNGANFHFQAVFYEAMSHEVVGSPNPILSTRVRLPVRDDAWSHEDEFARM
jgi:hypothetical protein